MTNIIRCMLALALAFALVNSTMATEPNLLQSFTVETSPKQVAEFDLVEIKGPHHRLVT